MYKPLHQLADKYL